MSPPNLIFQELKRSGEGYLARYKPPSSGEAFASLAVTFFNEDSVGGFAIALEKEARYWVSRFPVPVLTSAFNLQDDLIDLSGARESSHILAVPGYSGTPNLKWSRWEVEELVVRDDCELLAIYKESSHTTLEKRLDRAHKSAKSAELGWLAVFLWGVVGPLALLIAESKSTLLGATVLMYSLYNVVRRAMELTNRWPRSKRNRQRAETTARQKHYIYHCELNPEGFERLKIENIDRIAAQENRLQKSELEG